MNDPKDMTSQPGPGTTRRDERISPASRFTTRLLLQRSSGAKEILSNLKDLISMRAPKFAHTSSSTQTITLKDENFGHSQFASFAFHGSLALLLFMTFVASPPAIKKVTTDGFDKLIAPPAAYLRKLMLPQDVGGNRGGGGGGERSPIPATFGQLPPTSQQQIVAPSAHTFPNSVMLIAPTVESAQNVPTQIDPLEGWGDPTAKARTGSNGSGCCQGIGDNGFGTGVGGKQGPGAGPGIGGVGSSAVGPPGRGVRAPTCAFCPRPEYSDQARQSRFQGLVELNVVVQADGRPGKIELVSGPGLGLDEKAIEAVRNWRFNPAIGPTGKAVAVVIPIEVQFQLF
ncbi:MAG TPA: energy transducer TonB [Candidatus Acidoferrales bacterium]